MQTTMANPDLFVTWTDNEIIEELNKRVNVLTIGMIELAEIVGVAYRRGIDISKVGLPALVIDTLRKIESGQIFPDLAERYMHTRAFNFVKSLPLDDQKLIVKSGTVLIVERSENGKLSARDAHLEALTINQLRQVFDRGRIRSQDEQKQFIIDVSSVLMDEADEETVCVKVAAEIDMTKSQRRTLNQLKERAGSMSALVKHAILKLL